jgi:uncharacterized protein (DUF779 family)
LRLSATPAAHRAIATLRAGLGDPLIFVSAAGTALRCFRRGDYPLGSTDELVGVVDDCPLYIDRRSHTGWHHDHFVIDVEPGEPMGLSLPAGRRLRFVAYRATHESSP